MSRKLPDFKQGNYYHVYNRGANKNQIFFDRENYLFLLRRLKKYISKFAVEVIAYCLMPNHYHFLMRQDGEESVGTCIQSIFNSYTKAINNRYKRSGTLFEGPYRAIHVDKEEYLTHLCRYIHRNPLDARLVHTVSNWPFSNYPEWIDERNGSLYDPQFVKQYFHTAQAYISFVEEYEPNPKISPYLFV